MYIEVRILFRYKVIFYFLFCTLIVLNLTYQEEGKEGTVEIPCEITKNLQVI